MLVHILKSKSAKAFFKSAGLKVEIAKSAHNAIRLANKETGETITTWAESEESVAAGIPGVFIEE